MNATTTIVLSGQCDQEFSQFDTSMLAVGTVIIVLLSIFKFVSNQELKYRVEFGQRPPGGCCASIPHAKPGLSWDP
ncbi:hypothetical protein CLF_110603 [Clonorchis sinensis]|uniref:Uncharacterized protein n=1 Tax=Clonorchis sinensis TaxID=79923 RepID=G7YTP9_CLOSI|nr:hypothetical protein CLF_110603 [Clonorchis sinensis]